MVELASSKLAQRGRGDRLKGFVLIVQVLQGVKRVVPNAQVIHVLKGRG